MAVCDEQHRSEKGLIGRGGLPQPPAGDWVNRPYLRDPRRFQNDGRRIAPRRRETTERSKNARQIALTEVAENQSNENKMGDGCRERASTEVGMSESLET